MRSLIYAVLLLGCRDTSGTSTTTTTGAGVVTSDVASQKITIARCAHETQCNNIGPGKTYGTMDVCIDKMKTDVDSRFGECTNGVDSTDLQSCVDDIREEACGNPVDAMSRILTCSKTKLCR